MARTASIAGIKKNLDSWVSRIEAAKKVMEEGPPEVIRLRAEFKSRATASTVQAEIDRLKAEQERMVALLAEVPGDDTPDSEADSADVEAELADLAEETEETEDFENETETESV